MKLEEAVDYFGSGYALCRALGITPTNYTQWIKNGRISYNQQERLEILTDGKLKMDADRPARKQRILTCPHCKKTF